MDIWYTENHTDNVRLSIRIDRQLASVQSEFQRIDVFDSVEFGRIMTLDGLLMGTRCGTLDPACVEFIANTENKTVSDVLNMMNKKSGLLGLTGSSDMRDVTKRMDEGDENAKLAIEMWTYTVQKYIGSYIAAMNGCDAIIFTAGIGENHIRARKWVCEGLSYFGIKIDDERNDVAGEERMISTDDSRIQVWVIPTNEELAIARDTLEIATKK